MIFVIHIWFSVFIIPDRKKYMALPASNLAVGSVFNLDFLFFTYFM